MAAKGIVLFNSSFIGSSVGTAQSWTGGRSALILTASQYGAGVFLQMQALGNASGVPGVWIPITSALTTDAVTVFDGPPGMYRVISNQGSSISVVAELTSTPYI